MNIRYMTALSALFLFSFSLLPLRAVEENEEGGGTLIQYWDENVNDLVTECEPDADSEQCCPPVGEGDGPGNDGPPSLPSPPPIAGPEPPDYTIDMGNNGPAGTDEPQNKCA